MLFRSALLLAASPALAAASAAPLGVMAAAGIALAWLPTRGRHDEPASKPEVKLGNPFRLVPALKFGAAFATIRLMVRAAGEELGEGGVLSASFIGGTIDVDSIVFSLSGLLKDGQLGADTAVAGVFLGLIANAGFKTFLAFSGGNREFGTRVVAGFAVMFTAGAAVWALRFVRG